MVAEGHGNARPFGIGIDRAAPIVDIHAAPALIIGEVDGSVRRRRIGRDRSRGIGRIGGIGGIYDRGIVLNLRVACVGVALVERAGIYRGIKSIGNVGLLDGAVGNDIGFVGNSGGAFARVQLGKGKILNVEVDLGVSRLEDLEGNADKRHLIAAFGAHGNQRENRRVAGYAAALSGSRRGVVGCRAYLGHKRLVGKGLQHGLVVGKEPVAGEEALFTVHKIGDSKGVGVIVQLGCFGAEEVGFCSHGELFGGGINDSVLAVGFAGVMIAAGIFGDIHLDVGNILDADNAVLVHIRHQLGNAGELLLRLLGKMSLDSGYIGNVDDAVLVHVAVDTELHELGLGLGRLFGGRLCRFLGGRLGLTALGDVGRLHVHNGGRHGGDLPAGRGECVEHMRLAVELQLLCFNRVCAGILRGLGAVFGHAVDDNIGVGRMCEVKVGLGHLAGGGVERRAACRHVDIEIALLGVVLHQGAAPAAVAVDDVLIGRLVVDIAFEA